MPGGGGGGGGEEGKKITGGTQAILPRASSNKVCLLCENVFGLPSYPCIIEYK